MKKLENAKKLALNAVTVSRLQKTLTVDQLANVVGGKMSIISNEPLPTQC